MGKNLSLTARQLLVVGLGTAGLLIVTLAGLYALYKTVLDDRIAKTQNLVESVDTVLVGLDSQVKSGELTLEEAQSTAIKVVESMRYGEGDYFWINDMTPKMIMHPLNSSLNGKDVSSTEDPTGKKIFVEMIQTIKANNGQGEITYKWAKPGYDEPVDKISYVKLFKPWGWVVGTGIYVDDIRKATMEHAVILFSISITIMVIMVALALVITRSIINPLKNFSNSLTETASDVAGILQQSTEATNSLAAATEETSAQSTLISNSAREAEQQVAGVHTALEELNISITDISNNVNGVNDFVQQAVNKAGETNKVVSQLTETTEEITAVVTLITSLADQTNLLALNAAIEAARAGDAGRGFAVVADEVKKLATNTSNATGQIGENVNNIKQVSEECAVALREVITAVEKIQDNTTAMSAAVEEQTSVVKNVTDNMRMTAEQVTSVTTNMQSIEEAVSDSSHATHELSQVTDNLNKTFNDMQQDATNTFEKLGLRTKKG